MAADTKKKSPSSTLETVSNNVHTRRNCHYHHPSGKDPPCGNSESEFQPLSDSDSDSSAELLWLSFRSSILTRLKNGKNNVGGFVLGCILYIQTSFDAVYNPILSKNGTTFYFLNFSNWSPHVPKVYRVLLKDEVIQ